MYLFVYNYPSIHSTSIYYLPCARHVLYPKRQIDAWGRAGGTKLEELCTSSTSQLPPQGLGAGTCLTCGTWESSHCHYTRRCKSASPQQRHMKRGYPHFHIPWLARSSIYFQEWLGSPMSPGRESTCPKQIWCICLSGPHFPRVPISSSLDLSGLKSFLRESWM